MIAHPILAVLAGGGALYAIFACPPALKLWELVHYGLMLVLAVYLAAWPAWVIFITLMFGDIIFRGIAAYARRRRLSRQRGTA